MTQETFPLTAVFSSKKWEQDTCTSYLIAVSILYIFHSVHCDITVTNYWGFVDHAPQYNLSNWPT